MRPFVGAPDAGELDIAPLVQPSNLFPFGEHGGFALIWSAPKTREVHTFIRKAGRGRWAKQAVLEMVEIAREQGTERLWTKIPPHAPNVAIFARSAGFEPTGEQAESTGEMHDVYARAA